MICCIIFFNDPSTTEIYTLSYTTLFRSSSLRMGRPRAQCKWDRRRTNWQKQVKRASNTMGFNERSEEHTSELQSHSDLVCRLLLEKKNILTHFLMTA